MPERAPGLPREWSVHRGTFGAAITFDSDFIREISSLNPDLDRVWGDLLAIGLCRPL